MRKLTHPLCLAWAAIALMCLAVAISPPARSAIPLAAYIVEAGAGFAGQFVIRNVARQVTQKAAVTAANAAFYEGSATGSAWATGLGIAGAVAFLAMEWSGEDSEGTPIGGGHAVPPLSASGTVVDPGIAANDIPVRVQWIDIGSWAQYVTYFLPHQIEITPNATALVEGVSYDAIETGGSCEDLASQVDVTYVYCSDSYPMTHTATGSNCGYSAATAHPVMRGTQGSAVNFHPAQCSCRLSFSADVTIYVGGCGGTTVAGVDNRSLHVCFGGNGNSFCNGSTQKFISPMSNGEMRVGYVEDGVLEYVNYGEKLYPNMYDRDWGFHWPEGFSKNGVEKVVVSGVDPDGAEWQQLVWMTQDGLVYDAAIEYLDAEGQPYVVEHGTFYDPAEGVFEQAVARTHTNTNLNNFINEYTDGSVATGSGLGELLEEAPPPDDPSLPLTDIEDAIFSDGILAPDTFLGNVLDFEMPVIAEACPLISFPVFGETVSTDLHCQLWDEHGEFMRMVFQAFWSVTALIIFLGA